MSGKFQKVARLPVRRPGPPKVKTKREGETIKIPLQGGGDGRRRA